MRPRSLTQNSALALLGDGASKLGAFVVILVAARSLPVPEFAMVATGLAAAGVIGAIADLGAGQLLSRDGARGRDARGELFTGLLVGRAPLAALVLAVALIVGLAIGQPVTAAAVALLGLSGALSVSVLALFRSCQDIRPEALQRIAAAVLSILAAIVVCVVAPSASVLMLVLTAVALVTLGPLVRLAPSVADLGRAIRPTTAMRRAAPIGLLALATVAYYRAGTLALAGLADSGETAAFGVAASIAFGMLMIPNAVTTALLPRLAAAPDANEVVHSTRRALGWTVLVAAAVALAAAVVVPIGLPHVLGDEYERAGHPFVLLCAGVPLIAASGVIGTALLSLGRLRPLGVQVSASLTVNLALLVVLAPALGATGAALATVSCEAVGLVLLLRAGSRALPGLIPMPGRAFRRRLHASGAPAG